MVKNSVDNIDIRNILNGTKEGQHILKLHPENPELTITQRLLLVSLISSYFCRNENLTVKNAEFLAHQIKILFPKEIKALYFMRGTNNKPGGLIYTKYTNDKAKLKKAGVIPSRKANLNLEFSRRSFESEEDAQRHISYMLYENCSWEDVEKCWPKCQGYRANFIKENTVARIFTKWPQYTNPAGYRLIEMDYNFKYANAKSLLEKWDDFEAAILPIMKLDIKTPSIVQNIEELNNFKDRNGVVGTLLLLLHNILIPTSRIVVTDSLGNKKTKRFTILDSQNSFIMVVPTAENVFEKLNELRQKKIPIQPFIVIIGKSISSPDKILIYFDETKYKFSTVLKAVDIYFKIFQVFNLEYPPSAHIFWTFIQKYFYNINTESDVSYLSVEILKEKLN